MRKAEANPPYPLIALCGPTASGKSALGLRLAELLNGEIINYDSIQVYRGMDIGSGKVPKEDRRRVPHHLLDVVEPYEAFTAGDYRKLALNEIGRIRDRGNLPILVGGTGLYLRALLEGLFRGPARSEGLRVRLREITSRRGRTFLHRLLRRLDPAAAERIHPNDAQKAIRAIEVCVLARQPISVLHGRGREGLADFRAIKVGLNPRREELYERIDCRVEWMFSAGLLDETCSVLAQKGTGIERGTGPLGALGYRQAVRVLEGELSLGEAVSGTQTATRRYAKRQMTWFRRERDVIWYEGFGDDPEMQLRIVQGVSQRLPWSSKAGRAALSGPAISTSEGIYS
ncbi:MAG TPA: tRNA (adenosine(37)-N6)-dimethylallyltransferase MiaA [Terriglobia bacterium]|nr:tRNA (adenosine(37)-N6)-dimethylallyltransferase MiaA [Terriglobia bacterium]